MNDLNSESKEVEEQQKPDEELRLKACDFLVITDDETGIEIYSQRG